jgi:hypothetical protein
MGYFTDDTSFGQIDKDSIQRAHVDQLYMKAQELLTQTPGVTADVAAQANAKLAQADAAESQMNFTSAIQYVFGALQLLQPNGSWAEITTPPPTITTAQFTTQSNSPQSTTLQAGSSQQQTIANYIIVLVAGIVIGSLAALRLRRRNTSVPSYSTSKSVPMAEGTKFCVSCGARLVPSSTFCANCGAKQN